MKYLWFQIILNFLYVCQSGSWHTSLMKSDKFRNISSSGWDLFLNFYGHIPWMLIHLFLIIQNFYLEIQLSLYSLDLTCYIFTLLSLLWVTCWDLWSCSYFSEKPLNFIKGFTSFPFIILNVKTFRSRMNITRIIWVIWVTINMEHKWACRALNKWEHNRNWEREGNISNLLCKNPNS